MNRFPCCWIAAAALLWGCAVPRPLPAAFPDEVRREDLAGIRIAHDLLGEVNLERVDGNWLVIPDRIPADTATLREALDRIFSLHARDPVATAGHDPDSLEAFGLDPGRAVSVRLDFGPARRRVGLSIGRNPDSPRTTYWLQEGRDVVHRVEGSDAHALPVGRKAWLSRKLFPGFIGERDIAELRVEWTDATGARVFYHLARVAIDSLVVVEPAGHGGVPRRKSAEILGRSRQLVADDFPDPSDVFARARAARPAVSIRILAQDGARHELHTIGEDDAWYYVRLPAGGVALLYRWRLRDLMVPLDDLTAPIPFGPEPDDGFVEPPPPPHTGVLMPHFHDFPVGGHEDGDEHPDDHADHPEGSR